MPTGLPLNALPIFFFIHIPKTAGISLGSTLNSMFRGFVLQDYSVDVVARIAKNPEILDKYLLVVGHMGASRKLEDAIRRKIVFVSVFRDPVARVVSLYDFIRRHATHPRSAELRTMSLLEAFRNSVQFRASSTNAQLLQVFGTASREPIEELLRNRNYVLGHQRDLDAFVNAVSVVSGLPAPADIPRLNVAPESLDNEGLTLAREQPCYDEAVEEIRMVNAPEEAFIAEHLGSVLVTAPMSRRR